MVSDSDIKDEYIFDEDESIDKDIKMSHNVPASVVILRLDFSSQIF